MVLGPLEDPLPGSEKEEKVIRYRKVRKGQGCRFTGPEGEAESWQ